MSSDPGPPERDRNPLAGVLNRLLDRERGTAPESTPEPAPQPTRAEAPEPRMLTVAGLGTDRGGAALRTATQWAGVLGRRPTITDLCCGDLPTLHPADAGETPSPAGRVPRARVPWELDRLRLESASVVLALLERLRRHEFTSDLTIVRIPVRQRLALMRAAFLSGALIVPIDESESGFEEALEVSREVLDNFLEVSIWPFATSPRCLTRFLSALRGSSDARVTPYDPGRLDLASALCGMAAAPPEGFLVGLLAPEPAELPTDLLRLDSVEP